MLANIALTALDDYSEKYAKKVKSGKYKGEYKTPNPIVRYADDFVIACNTRDEAEGRKSEITKFLSDTIGLTLSPEKTTITHIEEGFNFISFNIRKYRRNSPKSKSHESGKLIIKPQREKVIKFLQKVQEELDKNKTARIDSVIYLLNPKLQGFALYYRFAVSKRIYAKIDSAVWHKLWRWIRRRHPNKTATWRRNKYCTRYKGNRWTFTDKKGLTLLNIAYIPITRFVKIQSGIRVYGNDEQKNTGNKGQR